MRVAGGSGYIAAILLLACLTRSDAHESLYHFAEIRLGPETSEIEISVHAAELATEFGIDPAEQDTAWFGELSESRRHELIRRAASFAAKSFLFALPGESEPLPAFHFPPDQRLGSGSRPGSLSGTIPLAKRPASLSLSHGDSGKRLMLVVTRPGSFPEVHDIGPGESITLSLEPTP